MRRHGQIEAETEKMSPIASYAEAKWSDGGVSSLGFLLCTDPRYHRQGFFSCQPVLLLLASTRERGRARLGRTRLRLKSHGGSGARARLEERTRDRKEKGENERRAGDGSLMVGKRKEA